MPARPPVQRRRGGRHASHGPYYAFYLTFGTNANSFFCARPNYYENHILNHSKSNHQLKMLVVELCPKASSSTRQSKERSNETIQIWFQTKALPFFWTVLSLRFYSRMTRPDLPHPGENPDKSRPMPPFFLTFRAFLAR